MPNSLHRDQEMASRSVARMNGALQMPIPQHELVPDCFEPKPLQITVIE
jgi:hypothetical protein